MDGSGFGWDFQLRSDAVISVRSLSVYLKIVATLSIRNNITEAQIRGFLADARPDLEAKLATLVANAPSVAEAVLDDIQFRLKVDAFGPGLWTIYPKIILTVTVADGITEDQVRGYLEGYWDQFKTVLRVLIGSAPGGANAQIIEWHVHRLSGSVNEVE